MLQFYCKPMKLAITFLALISLYSVKCQESIIMNCYYISENNSYITSTSNKRDENALASAIYNKTYEKIVGIIYLYPPMKRMIVNIMIQ